VTKAHSAQIVFEPSSPIADSYIWNTKRESMFDGGVGNGKTTSGIQRLLILAKEFPGSRWAVARQTYKSLVNTTRKTFDKLCPPHWIRRDVKESMTLANGAEILWMHLDDMSEGDLRSLEINGAFVSQAEEIQPEMWEYMDSRIGRWSRPEWKQPCPPYLWGECNVNGHDWVYFRFHPEVFGNNDVKHYADGGLTWEGHPDRFYCFGSSAINKPMLDKYAPGYYDMLMRKPEAWKRRWVYGSRDIFEGAIHPDFRREIHVYDADRFDPFEAMDIKSCWGWFDYGLSAPTCLLLSASTSDNYHFITHEYYKRSTPGRTITIREHASAILKLMRDNRYSVRGVYADPSVFFESTRDRRTQVTSTAQEYRECGLYLIKADNNETASIANLQELMHINPALRNPVTKTVGSPRLFISSRCENLIDQIQLQRHAETRNPLTGEKEFTEERAAGIPDHAYDPLRYFANSSVWQAIRVREQPPAPQYRTTAVNNKPVKGYANPGQMPRTRTTEWRQFPNPPQPNRVAQN
jgi:hypothetical protein